MAAANAILVSKHPSTLMYEDHATINKIIQEMEAKHDLELERIKNERELKVRNSECNVFNNILMLSLFQAL